MTPMIENGKEEAFAAGRTDAAEPLREFHRTILDQGTERCG
jgi:hypothetical protein